MLMFNAWKRLTEIHAPLVLVAIAALALGIAETHAAQAPANQQQPPAQQAPPPSVYGPPPVQFEPATLDLGTLKPGADATGVIMVHNIGEKWLTIAASKSSCTCTAINLANTKIAPGQAIPLDVAYHASSTMGAKNAAVRILFDGYDLVEVPIVAYVGMAVRSEPLYIDALKKPDGRQQLAGEFTVFALDQKAFKVLAVNGKPPVFKNFDPQTDTPRNAYVLRWDLTSFDPNNNCRDASGERLPGWIVVETDHPDAPIIDLEIRHLCNVRKPTKQTDTWAVSDKRVLLGAVQPERPVEAEVLLKWLQNRQHDFPPTAVVSESPEQFTAEIVEVKPQEDGLMVKLKITPDKKAKGLIYGALRLHSNRQTGSPVQVIATVR